MKALKYSAGLLLATVGVFFVSRVIGLVLEPDPEMPWWMPAVLLITLGLIPLVGGGILLRRKATDLPSVQCPRCGCLENAPAGMFVQSHLHALAQFGGWAMASLWGASRQRQVRCVRCDALYFVENSGTRFAGIFFWVLLLLRLLSSIINHFKER